MDSSWSGNWVCDCIGFFKFTRTSVLENDYESVVDHVVDGLVRSVSFKEV